jgi:hypothetical protein
LGCGRSHRVDCATSRGSSGRLRDSAKVTGSILLGFRSENRGGGNGRNRWLAPMRLRGVRAFGNARRGGPETAG